MGGSSPVPSITKLMTSSLAWSVFDLLMCREVIDEEPGSSTAWPYQKRRDKHQDYNESPCLLWSLPPLPRILWNQMIHFQ